ncbi:hypothetical protein [Streptomyces sp. NPDC001970]
MVRVREFDTETAADAARPPRAPGGATAGGTDDRIAQAPAARPMTTPRIH